MNGLAQKIRADFNRDFTTSALKAIIIIWSLIIIGLALVINDKWLLAGILAYEVLP